MPVALRSLLELRVLLDSLRTAYDSRFSSRPGSDSNKRVAARRGVHIRFQILAAHSDRLLSEDCRPESRDLNISTKRRKQVPDRMGHFRAFHR